MMKEPLPGESIDVSEHIGLVRLAIRHYLPAQREHVSYDYEDLVQAGLLKLLQLRDRWDPKKGRWIAFAYPVVRHALTEAIRVAAEVRRDVGTRRLHSFQDLESSVGPELYGHFHEDEHSIEWEDAWMWCIEEFDERTKKILRMRFVEGLLIREIGE